VLAMKKSANALWTFKTFPEWSKKNNLVTPVIQNRYYE
jgi:hypothetical protein